MISGLPPTNWFTEPAPDVPSAMIPPSTLTSPSWAQLILHGSIGDLTGITPSPVITVSTDVTCSRCYLTAYKQRAQPLIHFTWLLHKVFTQWAGTDFTPTCDVGDARMVMRANRKPPHSPGVQDVDDSLRTQVGELTELVRQLLHRLEDQSDYHNTPSAVPTTVTSITSTLSSASRSALSQCDSFLSKISSQFETFLHEHSLQLASLYSRSNSSDSRETQFDNLLRSAVSSNDKRTDAFRTAVENNTTQVSRLVSELSRWNSPQVAPKTDDNGINTPQTGRAKETDIMSLPLTVTTLPVGTPPSFKMTTDTDTLDPSVLLTQSGITTCTECASAGVDLSHCVGCNRPIHRECLTPDSSAQLCSTCAATLHSDSDHTVLGGKAVSTHDQPHDGMRDSSSSPSTSHSSSSDEELIPIKRLSPRGKLPRTSTRFTRSTITTDQKQPSYSQSTLSFASKRASKSLDHTENDNPR